MWSRRTEANTQATRGFVLIEVLVAVGVAAIIMAALLRSFTATWAGINAVREEAESMLLARTLIADAMDSGKILTGTRNGTLGRYGWSLTTIPTPVAPPVNQAKAGADTAQPSPWTLYRVDLVITTPSGKSKSLETFRLGQAAK